MSQKSFSIPRHHHEKLAKAKRRYEDFIGEPKTWGEFLVDMTKIAEESIATGGHDG